MKKFILLFLLFLSPIHYPLSPAFKDSGWGTRPVGMGGAFTAVADDASGILFNPAGLARLKQMELDFMYAKLYTGLDAVDLGLNYAAAVYPIRELGSFGLNWANFVSLERYREDTVTLAYAKSVNDLAKQCFKRRLVPEISFGVNLKYLQHSYTLDKRTVDDPVFAQGNVKSGITADLGLLSRPIPKCLPGLSVGLMLKNITQPDVGLKTKDIVPAEIRLGTAYKIKRFKSIKNILFALDGTYRNQEWGSVEDKLNLHLGTEAWFIDELLGLRLGGNYNEVAFGFSFRTKKKLVVDLQLDYALIWPLQIKETTGSHRLSLTYRFGKYKRVKGKTN
ncbi:MAG: UPF0164 family protein [Elusimicrobiota bacterium]